MIQENGRINLLDKGKDIRLTMLCKIINEIANVPNKQILLPGNTRTRSKHGHKFHIMTKNTNEYKCSFFHKTYTSGIVCQKHEMTVKL